MTKINDAADVETTVLFLIVGLAIGEIAVRADLIRESVAGQRMRCTASSASPIWRQRENRRTTSFPPYALS